MQKLKVPLRPSAADHVILLSELTREESLTARQEKIVWAIYRELDRHLGADAEEMTGSDWWKEFVSNGVFWTEGSTFWENEGDLFVNDRPDLHVLFAHQPGIAFLKLPDNQHPHVSRFLQAAGIPLLSEAAQIEMADSTNHGTHPDLTARCRRVVPFILRYLFYREQESYRDRERAGSLDALLRTEVRICDDLHVVVVLCDIRKEAERSFASRFPTIYVKRDSGGDLDGLAAELSRMLGGSPGLEMFIAAALSKPDAQAVERLMQAQDIPLLPSAQEETLGAATMREEFQDAGDMDDEADESGPPGECADDAITADDAPGEWEDSSGRPRTERVPAAVGASREPAFTAETAIGSSQNGAGGHAGDLFDPPGGDEDEHEPDDETGSSDAPALGRAAPSRERTRGAEPTSPAWHPISAAETVAVHISDIVPPVAEERTRTTRSRSADGLPSPGEADSDFEDPVPNPHALDIGCWGERYAVSCLRTELAHRYPTATIETLPSGCRFRLGEDVVAEIRWLNWEKDTGVGCDIEVVEQGAEEYVEVKATSGGSRTTFEVTAAQWTLARQQRGAYRILRVFNTGNDNAFAHCYRDPYGMWEEGRLTARVLQLVI